MQSLAYVRARSQHSRLPCLTFKDTIALMVATARGLKTGQAQPAPAQPAGGGPRLDTWTLEHIVFKNLHPPIVPRSDKSAYSSHPINCPEYVNPSPIQLKVVEFEGGGYESAIRQVPLQRNMDAACAPRRRGTRSEPLGDEASILRSRQRAKSKVRLLCKQISADHLITMTTRETFSLKELKRIWKKFQRHMKDCFPRILHYVCVAESHPTNPDHLHLHFATHGRLDAREMVLLRRCWYMALGGSVTDRGPMARGGFDIKRFKGGGGPHRKSDKIASYLSKYITKNPVAGFNEKRYWSSAIDMPTVRRYWLEALTIADALIEVARMGLYPSSGKNDFFMAKDRDFIWFKYVPDPGDKIIVPF